jgi:hypothetical protein
MLFLVIGAAAVWIYAAYLGAERERQALLVRPTCESFALTAESLLEYNERHGHLPYPVRREAIGNSTRTGMPNGAGHSLYSWRGDVATYRDNWFFHDGGHWDPSSAWDDPANRKIANYPWQFCYDALVTWDFPKHYSENTSMMAITGPDTPLGCDGEPPKSLREMDGDTILVVEVRDSGLQWMAPGDLDIRTMPKTINGSDGRGISSRYPGGFHVLLADFRVWFVSQNVPFEELQKFFTLKGAREYDAERILGPYVLVRFKPRFL